MADESVQRDRHVKVFLLRELMDRASQKLREVHNGLGRISSDHDLNLLPYEDGKIMFATVDEAIERTRDFQRQILESGRVKAKVDHIMFPGTFLMRDLEIALEDATSDVQSILDEIEDERRDAELAAVKAKLELLEQE